MKFIKRYAKLAVVLAIVLFAWSGAAVAANGEGDFSLQVTPSPLVTNVKPGQTNEVEFKVRNAGSQAETLKIVPRSFRFNSSNQQLQLDDTTPPDIAQWIAFSEPTFTVQPGQWYTQKLKLSPPKDAGFSYSFALVISRKDAPEATEAGRLLKGSLALFTLVNVDRPGAVRKLEVAEFKSVKRVYEYLPAEFEVAVKNTGNTIIQPYGNIYIQRKASDKDPLNTLGVNDNRSYILPNTTRVLKTEWIKGFPVNQTVVNNDGSSSRKLTWDWDGAKISDIRIGRYTAKLVGAYNDGLRDVPIVSEVSFWVIPWKLLIALSVILGVVVWRAWVYHRTFRRAKKIVREAGGRNLGLNK